MKRLAMAALLALLLASCASQDVVRHEEAEQKKELALWQVLMYRHAGEDVLVFDDKWYEYGFMVVPLTAETAGPNINMLGGMCPVERAVYVVIDSGSNTLVRSEYLDQSVCGKCHRR